MARQRFKNYLASMQNFPNRLAQAITASGKPKGALAAHAGVALSTVSRWMAGTVPKAETLDLIANFLGVDAKWLLTGSEAPAPRPGKGIEVRVAAPPPERGLTMEERLGRMEDVLVRIAKAQESLAISQQRIATSEEANVESQQRIAAALERLADEKK